MLQKTKKTTGLTQIVSKRSTLWSVTKMKPPLIEKLQYYSITDRFKKEITQEVMSGIGMSGQSVKIDGYINTQIVLLHIAFFLVKYEVESARNYRPWLNTVALHQVIP